MTLYAKVEVDAPHHPKVVGIGPTAFALYVKGLCYSKKYLTDGDVPRAALGYIANDHPDPEGDAATLVASGLWTVTPTGWTVGKDNWARHQETREQVEAKRKADVDRKRAAREAKSAKRPQSVRAESERNPQSVRADSALQSTEYRVQSTEHRAQSTEYREQTPLPREGREPRPGTEESTYQQRDAAAPPETIEPTEWSCACLASDIVESSGESVMPQSQTRALAFAFFAEQEGGDIWPRLLATLDAGARGEGPPDLATAVADLRRYPDGALPIPGANGRRPPSRCAKAIRLAQKAGLLDAKAVGTWRARCASRRAA